MIYEFRTYDLKPRSVPEFEKRTAEKWEKDGRGEYSDLFGVSGEERGLCVSWRYCKIIWRNTVLARRRANAHDTRY